ncbi:MAG: SDR family oxidoreductase, partial [Bacteroidota bacterium]
YQQGMFAENTFQGKTILVTGGATGLGKSMSTYFKKLGAHVMIASRKEDVLKNTCTELQTITAGEIDYVVCDVRKYDDVERMMATCVERYGDLHVLVNNAAGNFVMPTERLSHKAFDVVTDIVLKGTYNGTLAAGKYWIGNNKPGNILNIITTYAFTGSAYVVPSACAKGGVLALTRSMAVEWAKYGIRTNAIAPGPFPTEGAWSRLFPEAIQQFVDPQKRIPMKRFGHHQELANLAAYLISDYSAYINGEVVVIDGGEWLKGAGQFSGLEAVPDAAWDIWQKNRS